MSGKLFFALVILIVMMACNLSSNIEAPPTPTITPTSTSTPVVIDLPSPSTNRCDGVSGDIEMQVLIGPSDAVGLEPVAVGNIPFTVGSEGEEYTISGNGPITYEDVLEKEWGTYSVEFDMEAVISGDCQGDEQTGILNMFVETSGEQLVEVKAEGYQGNFPWTGTQEFNLSFPIEEGATAEGKGWAFVLHLNE